MDCPEGASTEHCVTLSDIAANNSKYFTSNTEIFFLAGVHNITSQVDTWIGVTEEFTSYWEEYTVFNISLSVKNAEPTFGCSNNHCYTNSLESAIINCSGTNVGFAFRGVSNLTISGLKIVHCGANVTKLSRYPTLQASVFTSLFLLHVRNIILWDITIEHSIGFGLLALDLTEGITVNKCTFCYNHVATINLNGTEVFFPGGNAYIGVTGILTNTCSVTKSNLIISKSVYAHGSVKRKITLFPNDQCHYSLVYTRPSPLCNSQSAGLVLIWNII